MTESQDSQANEAQIAVHWREEDWKDRAYGFTELSSLHFAAEQGDQRMVEFLLSRGANVDLGDIGRGTPLFMRRTKAMSTSWLSCWRTAPTRE